ncbi:MAG: FUSC family protein, partial [Silvibacterium sp.]|nr:FUSC family protein [Silvibacterium sp.]
AFLKTELQPYPGRTWVVGRITIAATIVMIIVMTFRIPSGFIAAIFTMFISRENPTATLRSGVRSILAFAIGAAYTIVGVATMVDDPLTHFLWILVTLFISFYLIQIVPDYGSAVAFGFMTTGAIPFWDQNLVNVNDRVENTLWLAFATLLGSGVAIIVEYVFRRVHPTTDLTEGIDHRLVAVETVVRHLAGNLPLDGDVEKLITLYTNAGTSRLRQLILRSRDSPQVIAERNAAVGLLGRLVDLAGSMRLYHVNRPNPLSQSDRERFLRLADEIAELRTGLRLHKPPPMFELPSKGVPTELPFLPAMERTVALIPQALTGAGTLHEYVPAFMEEQTSQPLIVSDAFSNPEYVKFALRGMLSASACYFIYNAVDWRGLSTCMPTCIITALSTMGSSRQKQFLRLGGAIIGGVIFGFGAQIFILPYLDSIAGFTLLFAAVTAIAAWIATASPRLSYLGVQLALAFYLINLQEFTIQTSLAIARDRVFGVLLGLMCMWLIFDRLWVKNALDEMQSLFARNMEMFAELTEQLLVEDRDQAVRRMRQLRDQLNAGFLAVSAQADAVLFEFGRGRRRKLEIRDDFRRWQPTLRTLLLVQLTSSQYRMQRPLKDLPPEVAKAQAAFEKDVAHMMRIMADEVCGKTAAPPPDISASAAKVREVTDKWYSDQGLPLSTAATDVLHLTESIASILAPLHEDIHATFVTTQQAPGLQQPNQLPGLGEARS